MYAHRFTLFLQRPRRPRGPTPTILFYRDLLPSNTFQGRNRRDGFFAINHAILRYHLSPDVRIQNALVLLKRHGRSRLARVTKGEFRHSASSQTSNEANLNTKTPAGPSHHPPGLLHRFNRHRKLSALAYQPRLLRRAERRPLHQRRRPLRLVPPRPLIPPLPPLHGRHQASRGRRPRQHGRCAARLGPLASTGRFRHRGQCVCMHILDRGVDIYVLAHGTTGYGGEYEL